MTDVSVSRCPICSTTKNLFLCQACMAVSYCCRDHQLVGRDDHKVACNDVKMAKIVLNMQERELRQAANELFEEYVGQFWTIRETRPYMRARFSVVCKLLEIKSFDAVKAAFDHTMEMFRLCRRDHLGLRNMAPTLFLRLRYDQQCYDFLKWYATTGVSEGYDWDDVGKPFLDLRDENVFEAVNEFTRASGMIEVAHTAAVMLIKIRLLKDAQTLQNSYFMYGEACILPPEIVNRIRKEAVGKIIRQRNDILMNQDQNPLIEALKQQIHQLYQCVNVNNKYIWPGLINPANYLHQLPTSYIYGSDDHAAVTIQYVYESFVETTGAIEMIREMRSYRKIDKYERAIEKPDLKKRLLFSTSHVKEVCPYTQVKSEEREHIKINQ